MRNLDPIRRYVQLSQRINIEVSLVNQHPIAILRVGSQLVYSLIDFNSQTVRYPINQQIQLHQILVLAEPDLNLVVVPISGPIFHLKQILLCQLLDADQVELAAFMQELRQAYRTQHRTLPTVLIQAQHLNLLIFVLLVHASYLAFQR